MDAQVSWAERFGMKYPFFFELAFVLFLVYLMLTFGSWIDWFQRFLRLLIINNGGGW